VIETCLRDARPRLHQMFDLARQYDSTESAPMSSQTADSQVERDLAKAAKLGGMQYLELYSRNGNERRFDVTLVDVRDAWVGGAVESAAVPAAWRTLFASIDALVRPVLSGLLPYAAEGTPAEIESAGFLLSEPGAPVQNWHPDEALTVGLATVFVPLVDLSESNGPTELALATHLDPDTPNRVLRYDFSPQAACEFSPQRGWQPHHPSGLVLVKPLLACGSLLLFDWRTWHRGGPNASACDRPVAYVTYHARGVRAHKYKTKLPSLTAFAEKAAAERKAAAEKAAAEKAAERKAAEERAATAERVAVEERAAAAKKAAAAQAAAAKANIARVELTIMMVVGVMAALMIGRVALSRRQ